MADLFKDGFESGNTSAWSSETDDENDLTVTEAAALHGTYGLAALIDNNASMFVTDTTPASETRYRCRFYINPNGLTMGNNESIIILNARKDPTSASFYVEFKYTTVAGYQIKVYDRTDDTWAKVSNYYVISNASHCIEVDWTAATGDGANNGTFTLWIDGVEKQTVAAINNDTEVIDHVCFGCQSGIGAGTSGTMFFDDFASNNDGAEIGVISEGTDFTYSGTGSFAYSGTATQSNGYNFNYIGQTGKWSGLGMGTFWGWASYVDTILAAGFTELRIDIPLYTNSTWLTGSKAAVISAVGKGAKVIWGVGSGGTTITSTTWTAFRAAILSAAQWAQDNGVFEFQLGNEELFHNDGTTMTDAQLIINLKDVATDVQAIFTNGNVSYSCAQQDVIRNAWIATGRGNIDLLACNIYKGGSSDAYDFSYQDRIDSLVTAFGAEHTYLTEFSVSYTSLLHYSTNEAVQAAAVTEMIDYIKESGMTRAIFFCWKDDGTAYFGVVKADESYRLLWNSLIGSGGSSFRYSGSADCSHSIEGYIGSGSFNFSGVGVCYKEIPYIATGTIIFSGVAIQSYTWNYSCVASGAFELSGIGIYAIGFSYLGSGSYSFSGIATYVLEFSYIGNGTLIYSGNGQCSYDIEIPPEGFMYVGTGDFTYSGNATYTYVLNYLYSASGGFTFSGSAVLEVYNFLYTGSGLFALSGIARIVCHYNWSKVNKVKDDWTKVNKIKGDYIKVDKE